MPQDNARSKRELVAELQAARQRVVENETLEHNLKQTLTALEKAARKSENILNRMIEGYISLDRDMTVLSFNNAAERILGRKAEDVLGRTLFDAFPEARAALSEETFTAVLKNRKNLAFETHFNAGPYANWYDVRVYPEQDGLSAYFLVTTERKRAEEKLRAGAQTLQQLLDATPDRIMLIDLEENILTINEAAAKGINTTQEEIKGKNVHAYFPPNIIEARRKIYMEAMRTGTRRRYVDERQGITWESIYHPVRNLDGEIDRLAVYARDITEQRRNEEALRESEERYRQVVEGADDLIARMDTQGRYTFLNRVCEKILGLPPQKCVGLSVFDFIHPEDRKRTLRAFTGWIQDRVENATHEHRVVSRSGDVHHMLWNIHLQYDGNDQIASVSGIGRDITELKRAEEELSRALEAARMGTKAKSDFLARMSHEIRTPMNAILGMSEIVLRSRLDPEQQDCMKTLRSAAGNLLYIINDILDLSKVEAGKMELAEVDFNLRETLADTFKTLAVQAADKKLSLDLDVAEGHPRLALGRSGQAEADPGQSRGQRHQVHQKRGHRNPGGLRRSSWPDPEGEKDLFPTGLYREGHGHRHSPQNAGRNIHALQPSRHLHLQEIRRDRAGADHHQEPH